jgi:hypothetical protein
MAETMERYGVRADFTARSPPLHTQAVLQGALILEKVTAESIDHLDRYLVLQFRSPQREE